MMRCVLLCSLGVVKVLKTLDVLDVPEVIRFVLSLYAGGDALCATRYAGGCEG